MKMTAYVPCFNGARYLEKLIRSLHDQSRPPDQIIVVDDGSHDGSGEIARRQGATVIIHERNLGIGAARNSALRVAGGDVLMGLDVDAIPAPDYVERVEQAFENDSELAALCGRLIEAHSVHLPDRWRQVHMAQHHGETPSEWPRICFGSVTSARTDVLRKIGGWDPKYRTNAEDVDLTHRMRMAGLHWTYDAACVARHQRRDSMRSVLSAFWNWYAPRGRLLGHFDSIDSLASQRIGPVNWGIYRHKSQLDLDQDRAHLWGLTYLLPWWMTLHDLAEVERGAATAERIVRMSEKLTLLQGGSRFVATRVSTELARLYDSLFPENRSGSEPIHAGCVAVCESTALRFLPGEPLHWAQIEASLRRLELEPHLERTHRNGQRVFLANPPWYTDERQGVRAGSRWPFSLDRRDNRPIPRYVPFPFFLAQAAEKLNQANRPNAIVDAIAEGLTFDEFHERVVGYEPATIVMETSAASFESDVRIWKRLRRALPQTRIVLAGPHATAKRAEIMRAVPEVDLILVGEYEAALEKALALLESGGDLSRLPGVRFRVGEEFKDTGRPASVPFEEVGRPERLRLPVYNYRDTFADMPEPMAQVMATRGCPYECNFCQWPQVYYERRTIKRRSVESVFDEIRELIEMFGIRSVYFDDDMFSPGKEWIQRFVQLIRTSGLQFAWGIMSRADTFGSEQLMAMSRAGLRAVKYGVESGDQGMVDAMGKRLRLDTLRQTVSLCRELGISVHLTFTVGLPGESPETLAKTRALILELLPDSLQISRAMPLPGTALEDWAVENDAMSTDDPAARDGFLLSVLQYPGLSAEEMDRFIKKTYVEYREARAGVTHPPDAKQTTAQRTLVGAN